MTPGSPPLRAVPAGPPAAAVAVAGAPPSARSIGASATRASAWVIGGYGTSQLVRFLANLVLARILFPEVFGLSALVFVVLQGLAMFSDVGTGPAIVQSPRGEDPAFLNTAWTIGCVRGLLLWLASCALGRPLAALYGQPLLAWFLPAAGLGALLAGLAATSIQTAKRRLQVGRQTFVDLVSQVAGSAAMIALALAWRRALPGDRVGPVWAVIGGSLLGTALQTVLSHTVLPGIRHRFQLDREARGVLFGFGRWVFLNTMLTFLAGQSDRLILGKLVPMAQLGVYGIAAALSGLAREGIQRIAGVVLFPAFSRYDEQGLLDRAHRKARMPLLVLGGAAASGFVACGPALVGLLYDARYADAGWILRILAVGAWFQVLDATNGAALLASKELSWLSASSAAKLAGLVLLLPAGFALAGLPGAVAALALSDAVKYAVSAAGVRARGLGALRQDAALTALVAAVSAAATAAVDAAVRHGGRLAPLAAGAAVVGLAWGAAGLRTLRRIRRG